MKILAFWKTLLIAIIILVGSLTSNNNINSISIINFKYSDKVIHFIFYLILSLSFLASLTKNYNVNKLRKNVLTLILITFYGIIIEILQYYFTIDRSGDILDALANTLGCIFSIMIFPYIYKLKISILL